MATHPASGPGFTPRQVNDNLPSAETIARIANTPIYDAENKELPFRSLYESSNGEKKNHKTLIIFIRHFYCGSCQEYVRAVSTLLPSPSALASLSPPISITFIGHGSPSLIPYYTKETTCLFPIYTDPTRTLITALGSSHNMARSEVLPQYITDKSLPVAVAKSIWKGVVQVASGGNVMVGGSLAQNGGEFLWVGGEVKWCHRMRDSTGHVDVDVLRRILGLSEG